jgi:hypothetical protein
MQAAKLMFGATVKQRIPVPEALVEEHQYRTQAAIDGVRAAA